MLFTGVIRKVLSIGMSLLLSDARGLHRHCMGRDIKPHNFVLKPDARLILIDFGSAAPLLPVHPDGSQQVPKRCCLVPCGTCDYISPEILQAHEAALVALEMSDEPVDDSKDDITGGYGRETDWWSLGAMLYEMVYGVAPFFANDIRQTYLKITDHSVCLLDNAPDGQLSNVTEKFTLRYSDQRLKLIAGSAPSVRTKTRRHST